MKMKKSLFISILVVLILSASAFAQTKKQSADDLAVKLQQKVLLTEDQTDKVKDILMNYFNDATPSDLQSSQKSIEALLDKKQKAKYEIIKADWWNSVSKAANIKE